VARPPLVSGTQSGINGDYYFRNKGIGENERQCLHGWIANQVYRRAICNDPAPKGISPDSRLYRPVPFEVCYLSWGKRHYGDAPLAAVMSEGWHYFVVLSGAPLLLVGNKRIRVQAGTVNIADPECALGHSDKTGNSCEMLTWIWRTPPTPSVLKPTKGSCVRFMLKADQLRGLRKLHRKCREAVAASNEHSSLQLRIGRLQLDLCLIEATNERWAANRHLCIELAIDFLRNHLGEVRSIHRLREYLQISDASLKRLFHEHTGKSPRAYFQELRMQRAREQLLPRANSVKSVAYALGYRYPSDFSRAFKREFGMTADSLVKTHALPARGTRGAFAIREQAMRPPAAAR